MPRHGDQHDRDAGAGHGSADGFALPPSMCCDHPSAMRSTCSAAATFTTCSPATPLRSSMRTPGYAQ